MREYTVEILKRRRLPSDYRDYKAPTYSCKCGFFTDRITVAFVHAWTAHGDRTCP